MTTREIDPLKYKCFYKSLPWLWLYLAKNDGMSLKLPDMDIFWTIALLVITTMIDLKFSGGAFIVLALDCGSPFPLKTYRQTRNFNCFVLFFHRSRGYSIILLLSIFWLYNSKKIPTKLQFSDKIKTSDSFNIQGVFLRL